MVVDGPATGWTVGGLDVFLVFLMSECQTTMKEHEWEIYLFVRLFCVLPSCLGFSYSGVSDRAWNAC